MALPIHPVHAVMPSGFHVCQGSRLGAIPFSLYVLDGWDGWAGGLGQWVWRARLTCHLGILRLISLGFERCRRVGLSRRHNMTMARVQPWSVPGGGKIARLCRRALRDP